MGIKLADIVQDATLPDSVRTAAIDESLALGSINDLQDMIGTSASPEALPLIRDVATKKIRDMFPSKPPYLSGTTIDEVRRHSHRL